MSRFVSNRNVGLALVIAILAIGGTAVFHHLNTPGASHSHEPHADATQLKLNDGKKWDTDAPLRLGMDRLRALANSAKSESTPEERQAFAAAIREEVDFLVANCKLQPPADEALHVLIAQLLEGANAVVQNGANTDGLTLVRKTLETYPAYFDHPGWLPVNSTTQ